MCFAQTYFALVEIKSSPSDETKKILSTHHSLEKPETPCYENENMLLSAAREKRNRKQLCLIRVPKSFIFASRRVGDQIIA